MRFDFYARFPLLSVATAALFFLGPWQSAAAARAQATSPDREAVAYYGVYLNDGKMGSAIIKTDTHATRDNKPAIRSEMQMNLDIRVLGASSKVVESSVNWTDPKTGAPIASESRNEAAGRVTTVTATYTDRAVSYVADIQGEKKSGTLTLKPGERFLVDPSDGAQFTPHVGMKLRGKVFMGELFQLMDSEISVAAKETVDIGGVAVSAYRIMETNMVGKATIYANDAGDVLQINLLASALPMQIRKEPKDVALAPPGEGKSPDLIALTSIKPSGEPMTRARTAKSITYEISGVAHSLPPSDTVESTSYRPTTAASAGNDKSARIALVTVRARALPTGPTVPLFHKVSDAPERLRRFLQSTPYVPADDPEFVRLAHEVVGSETDAARAATKIAAFVHKTVRPDPGIAALRTARDIYKDPRGVCRDYTTLFTALARSAGLVTKQCVGMGYGGGFFIGHAWPEVWVGVDPATGADHWVALEPTWGVPYADSTHIKMAEGEITDFYNVAADLGNYKIKVLSVE